MIRKIFLAAFFFSLLGAGTAEAVVDYLTIAYQRTLYPSRMVLLYDQCVYAGIIDNDESGISAEVRFQSYLDKAAKEKDPLRHKDVRDEDVAAYMHKAFDSVKKQMVDHPTRLNPQMCYLLKDAWPGMMKRYDLEPAPETPDRNAPPLIPPKK